LHQILYMNYAPYVLMFGHDNDDRYFTQSTLDELGLSISIYYASFSSELMGKLSCMQKPAVILLAGNLYPGSNMEIIREFKNHPQFAHIPIVVLSEDIPPDVVQAYYRSGANTVIKKPSTVASTTHKIGTFFNYWLNVAATG